MTPIDKWLHHTRLTTSHQRAQLVKAGFRVGAGLPVAFGVDLASALDGFDGVVRLDEKLKAIGTDDTLDGRSPLDVLAAMEGTED